MASISSVSLSSVSSKHLPEIKAARVKERKEGVEDLQRGIPNMHSPGRKREKEELWVNFGKVAIYLKETKIHIYELTLY